MNCDCVFHFCRRFRAWNWAAISYVGFSGGIITLWKKCFGTITSLAVSGNIIYLVISSVSHLSWILSVVYDGFKLDIHWNLWRELTGMSHLELPWLILGDFNSIISPTKHSDDSFDYYSHKAKIFYHFIE